MNRPSDGATRSAPTRFGEIHRSGDSAVTGTRGAADGAAAARNEAICRAACRPDSAAMSAVSAA